MFGYLWVRVSDGMRKWVSPAELKKDPKHVRTSRESGSLKGWAWVHERESVCIWLCVWVGVCMCVTEREREHERMKIFCMSWKCLGESISLSNRHLEFLEMAICFFVIPFPTNTGGQMMRFLLGGKLRNTVFLQYSMKSLVANYFWNKWKPSVSYDGIRQIEWKIKRYRERETEKARERKTEDAESCGWGRNVTANFLLNISPDGFYVFSSVGRVSDFT